MWWYKYIAGYCFVLLHIPVCIAKAGLSYTTGYHKRPYRFFSAGVPYYIPYRLFPDALCSIRQFAFKGQGAAAPLFFGSAVFVAAQLHLYQVFYRHIALLSHHCKNRNFCRGYYFQLFVTAAFQFQNKITYLYIGFLTLNLCEVWIVAFLTEKSFAYSQKIKNQNLV
jgi:hypothetical protein